MADESPQVTADQVESLIDELMGEIFSDSGVATQTSMRGKATTSALFEAAFGSTSRVSQTSMVERLLIAQAFAAELADTLAPALAEQLAPRLLKALEELMTVGAEGKRPASGPRPSGQGRKPDTK
jgi:hypothetical protein